MIRAGASGGATFNALTSAGNEDGFYNTGWDFTGVNRVNELYEQATVNDLFEATSPTHYNDTLTESLGMVDGSSFYFTLLMEEIIMLYDELNPAWATSIIEALTLTDSLSTVMGLIISDWLTLIDSQTNNWNGREIVPDTLNLYDILQMGKRFSDTITESITITDIVTRALTIAVLEYLGFTELVNAIRSGSESVNDAVELSDSPAHVLSLLINDILFAVDVASIAALFMDTVQESIGLADAASLINRIGLTVTDPITFTETLTSHGTLYSAVYDTLAMDVTVEFSGEVWECYVLNTPKFMPSMYSGFDFNSYCVFENRAFGANDTGIYELTGTTDAGSPIHTGAILSETDFGAPNQKRFRHGYLGISGTNPVMVFETDDGSRQVYNIDTRGKVVASHELKAKKWKLSVADYESLDTIKLIPIVLTK